MNTNLKRTTEKDTVNIFTMQVTSCWSNKWELVTILEEERNCFLYEKIGGRKAEFEKKLNDKTTHIY